MKTLILYYSFSETTKTVCEDLNELVKGKLEEIVDNKPRKRGFWGFIRSGFEAARKKTPPINTLSNDVSKFDLVIVATPVWAGNMSSPIRTLLTQYKFKKVAFIAVSGGDNPGKTFKEMKLLSKEPIRTLHLQQKEVQKARHFKKVKTFYDILFKNKKK